MMRVADLMSTKVESITPDTTLEEVLHLWKTKGLGGFPVVEGNKVVGMVTEGDLIVREAPLKPVRVITILDALIPLGGGNAARIDLRRHIATKARDLMSAPAITIKTDADIGEAARIFVDQRIRRLPVVDSQGALVGLISRTDLLRHLLEEF